MKKTILTFFIFGMLLLSIFLVSANEEHQHEIEEGRKLVESGISCDELNDEQLEEIGEYLMEQMHPGESHEAMHEMMDMEEGTAYHEQFHINLAERMYCGEGGAMNKNMMGSGSMMGMMPMMMNTGGDAMNSRGMMNMMGNNMMNRQAPTQTNTMQNMMGNSWNGFGYWSLVNVFYIILLIGLIILVIYGLARKGKESKTSIDILQRRYVKGEINKKQFEEMKKEIGK